MKHIHNVDAANKGVFGEAKFALRGTVVATLCAMMAACGGGDSQDDPETPSQALLQCDETMKANFSSDPLTKVLLVKAFKAGDAIALGEDADASQSAVAHKDVCLVKLLVGPGNPGSEGLPSTSEGIGMEIWLPAREDWNHRIRNFGGGGWAGGAHTSTAKIANPAMVGVAEQGWVTGNTDTGHYSEELYTNGAFAMKEDGTINTALWEDFAHRSLKELALKTRELALAYYGEPQEFAYWDGCSTGGRQGYKIAQENPELYDGYLIGAPVVNWTRFIPYMVYPHIVMKQDLGEVMDIAKTNLLSSAAVSACNEVGGQRLPFILNPSQCRYDPTKDASVLCEGVEGNGGVIGVSTDKACVSLAEATVANKIWYGPTRDGSAPDPALDNAGGPILGSANHLWWGSTRGTNLAGVASAEANSMGSDMMAILLEDPSIAGPLFTNPTGNGQNGYQNLTYEQFAYAYDRGLQLQSQFGHINTDNPDLSKLRESGGKVLSYHGWHDEAVQPMGSINYYTRAAEAAGGFESLAEFDKLYMVPGYGHCAGIGSVSPSSGPTSTVNNVPLPGPDQFFNALVEWTEKGIEPSGIELTSADGSASVPVCPYPAQAEYNGSGPANVASSYSCK